MKQAIVPATIVVTKPGQSPFPLPFVDFAKVAWLDDAQWTAPKSNLLALIRVTKEIEKPPGAVMYFEETDFAILSRIVNAPTINASGALAHNISPQILIQCAFYEESILNAETAAMEKK